MRADREFSGRPSHPRLADHLSPHLYPVSDEYSNPDLPKESWSASLETTAAQLADPARDGEQPSPAVMHWHAGQPDVIRDRLERAGLVGVRPEKAAKAHKNAHKMPTYLPQS